MLSCLGRGLGKLKQDVESISDGVSCGEAPPRSSRLGPRSAQRRPTGNCLRECVAPSLRARRKHEDSKGATTNALCYQTEALLQSKVMFKDLGCVLSGICHKFGGYSVACQMSLLPVRSRFNNRCFWMAVRALVVPIGACVFRKNARKRRSSAPFSLIRLRLPNELVYKIDCQGWVISCARILFLSIDLRLHQWTRRTSG